MHLFAKFKFPLARQLRFFSQSYYTLSSVKVGLVGVSDTCSLQQLLDLLPGLNVLSVKSFRRGKVVITLQNKKDAEEAIKLLKKNNLLARILVNKYMVYLQEISSEISISQLSSFVGLTGAKGSGFWYKQTGLATLSLKSNEEMDRILSLNGFFLGSKKVEVSEKKKPILKPNSSSILIRNIPIEFEAQQIKRMFEIFGEIRKIRAGKDMLTGKFLGYYHVDYLRQEDSLKALELSGSFVQKKRIIVERSNSEPSTLSISTPGLSSELKLSDFFPGVSSVFRNSKNKNYYVEFNSSEEAEEAFKRRNEKINDVLFKINWSTEQYPIYETPIEFSF